MNAMLNLKKAGGTVGSWIGKDKEMGFIQAMSNAFKIAATAAEETANQMFKDRTGSWGRMKTTTNEIPDDVKLIMNDAQNEWDWDWKMFKSTDGQIWLVAKLWDDEESFSIVAAVIRKEYKCDRN